MVSQESSDTGNGTLPARWFVTGVLLLWALASVRLFYFSGSGEHDTFMMAAGVVRGARTGQVLNPLCYGPDLQFLFYYLFRVATLFWTPTVAGVLLAMNVVGALGALATPFLLLPVLRERFGSAARAALAVLLLLASPLYLFTVSYGHPFFFALPLSLISWLLVNRALQATGPRMAGWLLGSAVLQGLALMIRFEQIALFDGLLLGLFLLDTRSHFRSARLAGIVFIGALVMFFATRWSLADLGPSHGPPPDFKSKVQLLFLIFNLSGVVHGAAHLLSEVGIPLLLAGTWAVLRAVRTRQWAALLVGLMGAVPSVLVYLGNPSPPRHFYVAVVGLACLVAVAAPQNWLRRLQVSTPAILVLNLLLPWAFIAVDGKAFPERAMIAYNVIERTDRNKREIQSAFHFYDQLLSNPRARKVVIFGNWIHVAELMSYAVDVPDIQVDEVSSLGIKTGLFMRRGGVEVYAIEVYDPHEVSAMADRLRQGDGEVQCLSLIEGAPINDLEVPIPAEIHLWSV